MGFAGSVTDELLARPLFHSEISDFYCQGRFEEAERAVGALAFDDPRLMLLKLGEAGNPQKILERAQLYRQSSVEGLSEKERVIRASVLASVQEKKMATKMLEFKSNNAIIESYRKEIYWSINEDLLPHLALAETIQSFNNLPYIDSYSLFRIFDLAYKYRDYPRILTQFLVYQRRFPQNSFEFYLLEWHAMFLGKSTKDKTDFIKGLFDVYEACKFDGSTVLYIIEILKTENKMADVYKILQEQVKLSTILQGYSAYILGKNAFDSGQRDEARKYLLFAKSYPVVLTNKNLKEVDQMLVKIDYDTPTNWTLFLGAVLLVLMGLWLFFRKKNRSR
jgi:LPXTG-motif cell wall-anchored protein